MMETVKGKRENDYFRDQIWYADRCLLYTFKYKNGRFEQWH